MGRSYTVGVKPSRDAVVVSKAEEIAGICPTLSEIIAGEDEQLEVRGLSFSRGQGGGWLGTLKLTLAPDECAPKDDGSYEGGDFVAYGFGDTPWEAIADLEEKFRADVVNLTPDRYSKGRGDEKTQRAPRRSGKPRKR